MALRNFINLSGWILFILSVHANGFIAGAGETDEFFGKSDIMSLMIALNAHYDGKVIVPDEPLDLPTNQKLRIELEPIESAEANPRPKRLLGQQPDLVVYLAPDWEDPLPDDIWNHNNGDNTKP